MTRVETSDETPRTQAPIAVRGGGCGGPRAAGTSGAVRPGKFCAAAGETIADIECLYMYTICNTRSRAKMTRSDGKTAETRQAAASVAAVAWGSSSGRSARRLLAAWRLAGPRVYPSRQTVFPAGFCWRFSALAAPIRPEAALTQEKGLLTFENRLLNLRNRPLTFRIHPHGDRQAKKQAQFMHPSSLLPAAGNGLTTPCYTRVYTG